MPGHNGLRIKIFADGASREGIARLIDNPFIKGFTTNPTLMRQAGVEHYEKFARDILEITGNRPVSFEVISDDFEVMSRQAAKIASWGPNVYVKIPVTNTAGVPSTKLIEKLSAEGVKLNVTAVLTLEQVRTVTASLAEETPSVVSVFAGRIADTGVDPVPLMTEALAIVRRRPRAELLWASPRELLNLFHAERAGCDIITATFDILKKIPLIGKDLAEFSLDTVKMFHDDARQAGYEL